MRITIRRIAAGLALTSLTAVIVGPAAPSFAASSTDRGTLVIALPLSTLTARSDVVTMLTSAEFDPAPARYGVDTYQLVYRTVDPAGRPTIASGLLALPRGGGHELRTVSYTHGTEINRTDAPSLAADSWATAPPVTYASAGFAAVAPDYLGLGLGPGRHPFLDVPSETTAAVDLLRAARAFAPTAGRSLSRDVLVTGFSQGATAATGLARALQGGVDDWFRLRALAPISGAYDVRGVELPALRDDRVPWPWNVGYVAYLLVSWNRLHHLYSSPGEVFAGPDAERVEALFDGVHGGLDLTGTLPASVKTMLTPAGFAMVQHPTGRFAEALRVHDSTCSDWTPRVPVRLLLSGGDEQAPNANSAHCQARLRAAGAQVSTVDVGDLRYQDSVHLGSNIRGTAAAATWFAGLDH
jgi:hypothetical protein